ncbi:TetR/AcrR family transcriptional regulator [Croceicoccus sp. BE223]|uniref:TetR/AcrR family transcriptional regulator n=1 Tax=Croceicoccus sp. BE223 TaxID=2817716 RepID=UPI0028626566|nr:TetR/AcrR family transcriptional regulator [Croceicoccus sp. BE223]MDR7101090.1 AcrR family transcriptional regulator [Croceicoccus sp. BE223]
MSGTETTAAPRAYASQRMQDRRRKVLAATRAVIAEAGLDGFTMRQIADRAGVATATLFNNFQSREALVSQAVLDTFVVARETGATDEPESFEALDAYVRWTAGEIIALGRYVDAVVAAYFSRAAPNPIREILKHEAEAPYIHFLRWLEGERMLRPATDIALAAHTISSHVFAQMHAWSIGEIADADLSDTLVAGVSSIVRGQLARLP